MLPSSHRRPEDRPANLDGAGRSDVPLRLVEFQALWLPCEAAPGHEPSGHAFQIGDSLLVVHFQEGHRQDVSPVLHHPLVLVKSGSNVLRVVGPANFLEMRHPTGDGHIAQITAAMNEFRPRKQACQQT